MKEEAKVELGVIGPDINATPLRRKVIPRLFKFLQHHRFRWRLWGGNAVTIPFIPLVIKSGKTCTVAEAHVIQLVARNTTVPVPKIYCAFTCPKTGVAYIVQEKMKGKHLYQEWYVRPEAFKLVILEQLKSMMDQIRSIQPPEGTGVQNVCGGPLDDIKISYAREQFGPFETIEAFHIWLRGGWTILPTPEETYSSSSPPLTEDDMIHIRKEFDYDTRTLAMHTDCTWPLKLTHADLHPGNILVDGEHVTGIIDWGSAGWFPAYWEYARAVCDTRGHHVKEPYASKWLEPFVKEADIEGHRWCEH